MLANHDVAILTLANSKLFSMTIPAKLQSYMACGMPVLASVEGECASIIKESKSGFSSSPNDVNSMVNNVIKFIDMDHSELKKMKVNSKKYCERFFNKKILMDEMELYFK
ncbi:glycosyltransferase [Exiguobacterium sp. SL14]|nr:glycosyltransferase [Exiguobacterium sp. SL14]MCY1689898.1 glycosyltransferase [Exiguobacterium sp. SL14]